MWTGRASSSPPAAAPAPARRRAVPRGPLAAPGFELANFRGDGDGGGGGAAPVAAGAADALTPRTDVAVLNCERVCVAVEAKVKAVRAERCAQMTLRVPLGAVGGVELSRCRRVVVELGAPVSVVRVDDCDDVQIVASWAARVGYADDSVAAASGAEEGAGTGAGAGTGLQVLTTGSHAVRLVFPLSAEPDAPLCERLLPESLMHALAPAAAAAPGGGAAHAPPPVVSRVVAPGSWGAEASRAPAARAAPPSVVSPPAAPTAVASGAATAAVPPAEAAAEAPALASADPDPAPAAEADAEADADAAAAADASALAAEAAALGVRLVAFDFDLCVLRVHAFNLNVTAADVALRDLARDFADLRFFVALSRALGAAGVAVAIASFGRYEVIKAYLDRAFAPRAGAGGAVGVGGVGIGAGAGGAAASAVAATADADADAAAAPSPFSRDSICTPSSVGGVDGNSASVGAARKNRQLFYLASARGVAPGDTLFFDDDAANVAMATADGFSATHCPACFARPAFRKALDARRAARFFA
jgi:hypothetical protein